MKMDSKVKFRNISLIQYLILAILIFVLFLFADFDNLNQVTKKTWIKNTITSTMSEIQSMYINDGQIYLSVADINNNFNNSIYVDKISRIAILTLQDKVIHFYLNSSEAIINNVNINIEKVAYIKVNNEDYINLGVIAKLHNVNYQVDKSNNICFFSKSIEAKVNKAYVNILDSFKKINLHLNLSKWGLNIILDESYYSDKEKYYTVIARDDENIVVGHVLKKNINVQTLSLDNESLEQHNVQFKSMMVNNVDKTLDDNVDVNLINLIKLASSDGKIEFQDFENTKGKEVYAIYNNGYTSHTYDNSITSATLRDVVSRNNNIQNVKKYIVSSNLNGLVLDFRNLKVTDKEYFNQYVKEMSAILHSENKKIMLYVTANSNYIDINEIVNYVDNIIYVTYSNVSNVSKIAYSLSNLYDIEKKLQNMQKIPKVDMSKIILEVPIYSVVWIEKNNIVTGYELYNMQAIQNFVKQNNITHNIDKNTGLNYAELAKGNVKYKVWIEDENSIKSKYDLSQKYALGGIAIYKKGYEINSIYDILKGEYGW